jgi:hypothetical protein
MMVCFSFIIKAKCRLLPDDVILRKDVMLFWGQVAVFFVAHKI